MLLQDLLQMAKLGADRPLNLWAEEFKKIKAKILPQLAEIEKDLSEGTEVKDNIAALIELLKEMSANELKIAQGLSYVAEVLKEDSPLQNKEMINDYIQSVMKFISQAQTGEFSREARRKVLALLSPAQQKEHDLKLFKHEGMIYCLEYYLALYKAIQDAPTEAKKRQYIENDEINLGFGNVPGLWIDFSRDEVLAKFIYAILDDDLRNRLTKAYFNAKVKIMLIERQCDKQKNCLFNYQKVSLNEVMEAFRALLKDLLETFQSIGIDRLSSFSFTPYGNKPLISEALEKI